MKYRIAFLSLPFLLLSGVTMAMPASSEAILLIGTERLAALYPESLPVPAGDELPTTAQYLPFPCDARPFPGPGQPFPFPLPYPSPWPGPTDQCIPDPFPF